MSESLPSEYFERMFASDPDPWRFETSAYEAGKFDHTVASLGPKHFVRALEVGCANGVLTQRLGNICESVVAIDVSDTALQRARHRNLTSTHVRFHNMPFPHQTPSGSFDLILLSEVVYYWSAADIAAAGAWIEKHIAPKGDLLLVHWTGETDYPQTGDDAVRLLRMSLPSFQTIKSDRRDVYRLDLWRAA